MSGTLHASRRLHDETRAINLYKASTCEREAQLVAGFGERETVHARACRLVVRIQHRGAPAQQVPPQQLRLQVPHLPHHVPYDGLVAAQLRRHRLAAGGPFADRALAVAVPEDHRAQPRLLRLRRQRQRLAQVPAGVVQPSDRRDHALLHCRVRIHHDRQVGGLDHVRHPRSGCRRCRLASGGVPSFHLFGFIMCVGATAARALKSVLQGILLSSEGEKLNSMNLLLYMAPIAVVLLLPTTLTMEENVVGITLAIAREDTNIMWYLLFNSVLAYFVNLTNFLVTKHTSALTLQFLSHVKISLRNPA